MHVGEKIQQLRKREKMSQEELGQKLLVSRQTISLWETGQTFPTIDNLLRLKEIFSVSVDELIDENYQENLKEKSDEVTKDDGDEREKRPVERCTYEYGREDCREISSVLYRRKYRLLMDIIASIGILAVFFYSVAEGAGLAGVCFVGFVAYILRTIKVHIALKKQERELFDSCQRQSYVVEVYEDFFIHSVTDSGECVRLIKIPYDKLERLISSKSFYIIISRGIAYSVKKSSLDENSVFIKKCRDGMGANNPVVAKKSSKSFNFFKVILIVSSILSLFASIIVISVASKDYWGVTGIMAENMWIMYLFALIPTASLIFGCIGRKKGYGGRANVVIGIIMICLLGLYGSFSWMTPVNHSTKHVESVESRLEMDFPEFEYLEMNDYTAENSTQSYQNMTMIYKSVGCLSTENSSALESDLKVDERFITSLPSDFAGIMPVGALTGEYTAFYCIDTEQYNLLPGASGEYTYIYISFNAENQTLCIMEYTLNYIK